MPPTASTARRTTSSTHTKRSSGSHLQAAVEGRKCVGGWGDRRGAGISLEHGKLLLIASTISNFNANRHWREKCRKCSRRKSWRLLEPGNYATAKSWLLVLDCRKWLSS